MSLTGAEHHHAEVLGELPQHAVAARVLSEEVIKTS
jgi:hypothetical protein